MNIVSSPGSAASVKQVATGYTAQLGFADSFAVVLGRANNNVPVKLVAMIYHRPPQAVYVLKDAKISVCHGVGGMFAASGTIIFTNEK